MSSPLSKDYSAPSKSNPIREDLRSMTIQDILQLKEELGTKVYKEAVLGINDVRKRSKQADGGNLKRLNKNRPREVSAKKPVPFLGAELRKNPREDGSIRDPRFDENSGRYNTTKFKTDYKFLCEIREEEIQQLRMKLKQTEDPDEQQKIKDLMQRLKNKNLEENKWHKKQQEIAEEKQAFLKAKAEGRQPYYMSKRERRAKKLIEQYEELKASGRLNKYLEKRRKKNAIKDRKKLNIF